MNSLTPDLLAKRFRDCADAALTQASCCDGPQNARPWLEAARRWELRAKQALLPGADLEQLARDLDYDIPSVVTPKER
jgi:hypothetical protein